MFELRDYQKKLVDEGIVILKRYNILYLALEVRVGKTFTSLAIAKEYQAKKVLFVTKKKAIHDIISQARIIDYDTSLYVINYDMLHKCDTNFDLVIVDEAHSLGAYPKPSQRAEELKRICVGKPIIYLSGTPTPESYSQLYHQLWVCQYSPFKHFNNFYAFAKEFVDIRKKYIFNRAINDYSHCDYLKIKPLIEPIMLSLTQEEAGFESFIEEEIHIIEMEDATYKVANYLKANKIVRNREGDIVMGDTAVKLMNKLHQIYSGTVICDEPEQVARVFDYTKAEYIDKHFHGQKIVVFYKFKAEYYALLQTFTDMICNDIDEFNNRQGACIYPTQIVSGREGLNLSSADTLIFYNIDFSALSYWQSRARIQTKDRTKESKIHWLFAKDGIELKIYDAVMNKKDYNLTHFKKDFQL